MELAYSPERVSRLRGAALDGKINIDEYFYYFWKSLTQSRWDSSYEHRCADALYYCFEHVDIDIDPDELIVGHGSGRALTKAEAEEYALLDRYASAAFSCPGGQDSHMVVDYDLLLEKGVSGIKADISAKIAALSDGAEDIRRAVFYRAALRSLDALVMFSHRWADRADELARSEADPVRAQELRAIAENCRQVPENPPRTFWQALQSVEMLTFALTVKPLKRSSCQYQLGRPDRYLAKFYENDIKTGVLTRDGARMLVDCMAVMINRRVPHGLSSGYMVGGRAPDGRVVSNDLTRLFIGAVDDNRLVYPSVGLCTCPKRRSRTSIWPAAH